jgi:type I restriction enzyme M protein
VPKADIAANDYDLSINRYKEIVHGDIEYPAPREILAELTELEDEIQRRLIELAEMLHPAAEAGSRER